MSEASKTRRVRPRILHTVWQSWNSTWAAMMAMPLAFLATAAASVLVAVAAARLVGPTVIAPPQEPPAIHGDTALSALLTGLPATLAYALVVAPLAIAMHRFVVLGERQTLPPLRPLSRVIRYTVWVTLLGLSTGLPMALLPTATPVWMLIASLATIVLAVATVRLTLLLPQIAIQQAGEPLRTFWRSTRWRFWNTATVLALAVLPVLALQFVIILAAFGGITAASVSAASDMPLLSALNAPFVALGAAAASWLFLAYSRDGNEPETATGTAS